MRNKLLRQIRNILKKAERQDTIILCEDGKETDNEYPVGDIYEPDAKSPEDWVNSIMFFYRLEKKTSKLSFKLKK